MKKRAALYARVSTEEQVNNYSISVQIESIRQVAKMRDYDVVGEYIDEGKSGALLSRPALDRLLLDCKNKKIDIIIVFKIDRFFRDIRHLLNTMEELDNLGIKFISATEPFDTSTSIGKYIFGQFGLAAELERTTFLERSKGGRIKRFEAGKWWGRSPYGYKYNKNEGILEIEEDEAKIVRLIFSLYLTPGASLVSVTEMINNKGYRRKDGDKWTPEGLYGILTNEVYTGIKNMKLKISPVTYRNFEIKVPAIIDKETFKTTQKAIETRGYKKRPEEGTDIFLLNDFLYCACCSSIMRIDRSDYLRKGKRYKYNNYYCVSSRKNKCRLPWFSRDLIDTAVWDIVKKMLTEPGYVKAALKEYEDNINNTDGNDKQGEESIQEKLEKISEQKKALFRSYRKNMFTEKEMEEMLKELNSEEKILINELEEQSLPSISEIINEQVNKFSTFKKEYDQTVANLNNNEKRDVIIQLVRKVTVDDYGEITLYLHAEKELTIKTKIKAGNRYPRKKKKGRKPNAGYKGVSFSLDAWNTLSDLASQQNVTPTELARQFIQEWIDENKKLPKLPEFQKTSKNQHSGRAFEKRTSIQFKKNMLEILDKQIAENNFTFSGAIRYIVDEKINEYMQAT